MIGCLLVSKTLGLLDNIPDINANICPHKLRIHDYGSILPTVYEKTPLSLYRCVFEIFIVPRRNEVAEGGYWITFVRQSVRPSVHLE